MNNALDQATSRLFDGLVPVADMTMEARLAQRGERKCPVCGAAMLARPERDAVSDVCPQHGVWFDQDQWERFTARRAPERRPVRAAVAVARPGGRRGNGLGYYTDSEGAHESLFDLGGGD